jgi:stage II sporulation protein D
MKSNFYIKYFDKNKNQKIKLPLEKMVGILLASEINIDFHIEALKAQAIVLRTNLIRYSMNSKKEDHYKFNIKPLEAYKEIWNEKYKDNIEKINKAVKETENIIITFNNKPIDAKYHLICGGSTENSENVINNQVTYLRRVLCNHCIDSPYWKNEKSFSIEEIEKLLRVRFPTIDMDLDLKISGFIEEIKKDDEGRVISIKIGNKHFRGKELMELLDLNSTRFNIFPTEVKFVSKGKGHGLGLCQYGAEKMAREGDNFKDILGYYYTGVEIREIELPCINKPLFGKILVIDPGHGGEELGHKGSLLGLLEKDIVLNLSLRLKEVLEELGATIYLTREKDEKVLATKRVDMANEIRPDFFISFHMDYYPNSNLKGCEMFYFRDDYQSEILGSNILRNLQEKQIPVRGIKEGNFYIFRGINVSSLLIELGYLSNIEEEIKFKDEDYIKIIVEGIKKGILEYYEN